MILVGIGGHAKVVLDALTGAGCNPASIVHTADDISKVDAIFGRGELQSPEFPDTMDVEDFHVAIGSNGARENLYDKGVARGGVGKTVIHPSAIVAPSAKIDAMTFVAAGAVVAADAEVGVGAILNHNSITDHDCVVGDFCHLAPGAVLGGGVTVGPHSLIGAGAVVLPGIEIGAHVKIGAGSVVLKPVSDNGVWIGNKLASK